MPDVVGRKYDSTSIGRPRWRAVPTRRRADLRNLLGRAAAGGDDPDCRWGHGAESRLIEIGGRVCLKSDAFAIGGPCGVCPEVGKLFGHPAQGRRYPDATFVARMIGDQL